MLKQTPYHTQQLPVRLSPSSTPPSVPCPSSHLPKILATSICNMGFESNKIILIDFNGISVSRLGDECYQMMAEDTPVVE